jgi:hypothetical protein
MLLLSNIPQIGGLRNKNLLDLFWVGRWRNQSRGAPVCTFQQEIWIHHRRDQKRRVPRRLELPDQGRWPAQPPCLI